MKLEKVVLWIVLIVIIVLLVIQQIAIQKELNKPNTNSELENSIKELTLKIDSIGYIRDSLIIRVDTNKVKIIELEKIYEKTRDSIVTQSVDSDCITFSKYISDYKSRLSSNNNP